MSKSMFEYVYCTCLSPYLTHMLVSGPKIVKKKSYFYGILNGILEFFEKLFKKVIAHPAPGGAYLLYQCFL